MKIFNCILGVFAIIGAVYCIFYPGLTFLNSGWIMTVLLGAWGICAIFDFATNRKKAEKSKSEAVMGVLGLIAGIAAAVVSVLAMFMPAVRLMLDITILGIFSGWLMLSGVNSIIRSFAAKKAGAKYWVITLIWGILVLISGIYGVFHLIFLAQTIGMLMGILLMLYGFRLIFSVFEKN